MNISAPFIKRPVATTLLTVGLALAGILAFRFLPVSPLPQVDFPTIQVSRQSARGGARDHGDLGGRAPGASIRPHRRGDRDDLGQLPGRRPNIVLQFDLNRNIDGAARDVQAAINAARSYLPANLPNNPTYRKVNPADAPILILALTSDTADRAKMYDAASTILQQKLSQVEGVGTVFVGGGSLPAVRVELNPTAVHKYGIGLEDVRSLLASTNINRPKGQLADAATSREIRTNDQLFKAGREYRDLPIVDLIVASERGAGPQGSGRRGGFGGGCAHRGPAERQDRGDGGHLPVAGRQHHRDGGPDSRPAAATVGRHSPEYQSLGGGRPLARPSAVP